LHHMKPEIIMIPFTLIQVPQLRWPKKFKEKNEF
jgi:hypothetical protein